MDGQRIEQTVRDAMSPICAGSIRYPLQSRQEFVALYENWWNKYPTARADIGGTGGSEGVAGDASAEARVWCVR